LVIDPSDASQNTWYVCVWSGWGGPANDLGALFRTTDRGLTWSQLTDDYQFHRVSSVIIDPNDAETMYLTTEGQGLWVTHEKSDAHPSWTLVDSYPFHHPERVFFNPNDSKEMWVASFGNGMRMGKLGGPNAVNDEKQAPLQLHILGNPTGENLTLEVMPPHPGEASLALFDGQGRMVKDFGKKQFAGGMERLSLPVSGIAAGVYFLKMEMDTVGSAVVKVVVR